jgi:hypothetical protein
MLLNQQHGQPRPLGHPQRRRRRDRIELPRQLRPFVRRSGAHALAKSVMLSRPVAAVETPKRITVRQ